MIRGDDILFETEADTGVATLTMNRPKSLNALTIEMMDEVHKAMQYVEAERNVRALVLTGAGRGFCSGQDLKHRLPAGQDMVTALMGSYFRTFAAIRCSRVPVIIAVNGVAAGAGFSLALTGDLVIAARSARFIQLFSRIGLAPDLGSTWLLPRAIGRARALQLMLTAQPLEAQKALDWGMINDCVDELDLLPTAQRLARELASGPTRAFVMTRRLVDEGDSNQFESQFRRELEVNSELRESADSREGVSAFLEKRAARFNGE